MQRQLHTRARDHEDFYKQLSSSEDGFAKVAEYFGKGIFDSGDEDELATPASERGPLIADESHREGHRGAGQASRPAPTMGRRPGRGIGPAY